MNVCETSWVLHTVKSLWGYKQVKSYLCELALMNHKSAGEEKINMFNLIST